MIPALLSVVFVFYLYQTLNRPPETAGSSATVASRGRTPQDLSARLSSLQNRIEKLAEQGQHEGNKQ
jgi:hypothetical protein